ncbi:MAG TPA: hypothetical protein EYG85_08345 [Crocinitomix sp.]|nr:hypothetical protein [Crocinitomix sp.]
MKKLILLLLLGVIFTSVAQSQKPNDNHNDIKAQKIAFLTSQLNLTVSEAEKFWPIYNEYDAKIKANRKVYRTKMKAFKNSDTLTDDEAYTLAEEILDLNEEKTQIKKEYLVKFSKILGKKKGAKVFYLEQKFKRELLHKIRNSNQKPEKK